VAAASAGFTCAVVMTTEINHSATDFEQHEGRDHILQIIDGSTVYEVGGTLKNARTTKPGEQLAPASDGATKLTLNKGDMLTIPRGTPHRRTTTGSVTFFLTSPSGSMKA
ncbi:MAG: cupin domain-containing protein, partial [Acidobacteriaceae bacterium]